VNTETLRLLLRSQRLWAFMGRPTGNSVHPAWGDWEYMLWHSDDRRQPR
jgi:hypothetical protein